MMRRHLRNELLLRIGALDETQLAKLTLGSERRLRDSLLRTE
jgi:hypothetical protein